MLDLTGISLPLLLAAFTVFGLAILVVGVALTRRADEIAQATGLSAALVGALLLGATTSLPGTVLSISAAFQGHADLAIGNAIGGITAQTAFLALADLSHRRLNLEHAAASISTLMQAALLVSLLMLPLLALSQPAVTVLAIHPVSPVMIAAYLGGLRLIDRAEQDPMWRPTPEVPEERSEERPPSHAPWLAFLGLAVVAAAAGYGLGQVALEVADRTGLSQTAVGGALTAVVTSTPELVTALAAVRRGALQLAVGGIIGGNAYDVLFLAFSDAAYRDGSLYHAFTDEHVALVALATLMTGILILGLLKRDRHGPGGIGFESVLVLLLYGLSLGRLLLG
jgi:cation:H+ antiporter